MADISVAGEELEATTPRRGGLFAGFSGALAAEGERRILWAPVPKRSLSGSAGLTTTAKPIARTVVA